MQFTRSILRSFCTGNDRRPITCAPWSVGPYSYATDGHILVRVARADDVPDADAQTAKTAANIDKWIADLTSIVCVPLPKIDVPKGRTWSCDACDGRGTEHDCPGCECECDECEHGTCTERVIVAWRGFSVSGPLWRLIATLPNSQIATTMGESGHISFTFDGGAGIVMPMRLTLEDDPLVVNAEQTAAA